MTTTPEQVDSLLQSPTESQTLEFKEAKTQLDTVKLYQYCVAIANEGGGKLMLGVSDQPSRRVVGTQAFPGPVATAEKIYKAIRFRVDIEEVQHPDGRVVIFHIPSRPRATPCHYQGAYLMRVGQALEPMSEDRLREILLEGEPSWLEEPSTNRLSGQDVVGLLDTQTYFELLALPYPTKQAGVMERLLRDRLINRRNSLYSIKRLGALLLAKRLEDFPDLARKAPRVVVYTGTSKLETRLDHTETRGYAVGFHGLIGFVMSQLPQREVIEAALRKEMKLVPEIAIRELVANALIHQDFTLSGTSMMVEIYENRVEISNPGEPIVPVEHFIDGHESRNDDLARMMRRFGICEEKSSGVDKVIREAESCQLPAPDFHVGHRRTVVTIYGPKNFKQLAPGARARACDQRTVH